MSNQGLGDTIGSITSFFGIDKVADAVAKLVGAPGCGCPERKAYLNHLFPYDNYNRRFKVLQPFTQNNIDYSPGEEISVTKNSSIFGGLIYYVREGYLQEL